MILLLAIFGFVGGLLLSFHGSMTDSSWRAIGGIFIALFCAFIVGGYVE